MKRSCPGPEGWGTLLPHSQKSLASPACSTHNMVLPILCHQIPIQKEIQNTELPILSGNQALFQARATQPCRNPGAVCNQNRHSQLAWCSSSLAVTALLFTTHLLYTINTVGFLTRSWFLLSLLCSFYGLDMWIMLFGAVFRECSRFGLSAAAAVGAAD